MTAMPTTNGTLNGERTKKQVANYGAASTMRGIFDGIGMCPAGTYDVYRKMRECPTIAMARAAAMGPIKAASHSFEAEDGTPDDAVTFVQSTVDPLWRGLVSTMLTALDYGWASLEKVWGFDYDGRTVYTKLKPLLPDRTEIQVADSGALLGVKQGEVVLGTDKCVVFTYDMEGTDHYGRARHENIREHAWKPWLDTMRKHTMYVAKSAGIIPMVQYPQGEARDDSGSAKNTFDIAKKILESLGSGHGVAMPWELQPWAEQLLARGVDAEQLMAWKISFLEAKSGHGAEFQDALRYFDSLMMRGWLVPERVALEGQHGTKAESESHADVSVMVAQDTLAEIVAEINRQVVDPLLVQNFGEGMRGKVYAVPSPITTDERDFFRKLVMAILTQPGNLDTFITSVDVDALYDATGVPKSQEIVTLVPPVGTVPGAVPTDPAVPAKDIQAEALNGAQITSLQGIIASVALGELPATNSRALAEAGFPLIDAGKMDRIFAGLEEFTPESAPAPTGNVGPLSQQMRALYARMRK